MQNNNEPTNKLEELESTCEETKISSIAKMKIFLKMKLLKN